MANQFAFAGRIKGEDKPSATWLRLQETPHRTATSPTCSVPSSTTIHAGKPAYPVEAHAADHGRAGCPHA